jgi:hypothetical protein
LYLVNELGCCWLLSFGVLEFGLFADQWWCYYTLCEYPNPKP